jgi:hypothetical protein
LISHLSCTPHVLIICSCVIVFESHNFILFLVWKLDLDLSCNLCSYGSSCPWHTIHISYIIFLHDTSMYIHITYICTHSSRFEPKISWRCTRSSPPNHFKTLMKWKEGWTLLFVTWNYLKFLNFNRHFLFQNLLKCYKWKHDFEAYWITY